jgi:hypothetical protein
MLPKLYLETTIPSYFVARPSTDHRIRAAQIDTKLWWKTRKHSFEMCVSAVVLREMGRGETSMAAERLELVRGLRILRPIDTSEELAQRLLDDGIVPEVARDDASHIALAAAHAVDYLLTWNCKHINNRFIIRRIENACSALGLDCPVIATPTELMNLKP